MSTIFMFDVDNTLMDNDGVKDRLHADIRGFVGAPAAERFWEIYEEVRQELDYVDLIQTLERFRSRLPDVEGFPPMAAYVLGFPYDTTLYPGALAALASVSRLGDVVIVSDGDPVFQPAKIARAGLYDAVYGRVFIFRHKEEHIAEVLDSLGATHGVLIDDKPRILRAVNATLGERVTTVHVRQGKYAHGAEAGVADLEIDEIGELVRIDPGRLGVSPGVTRQGGDG
jgi:FMN phosphatase YigB (HAD superfamily)